MKDWQCCNCGHQMDGIANYTPVKCEDCGDEHFIDSEIAAEEEARNRAINAHDDYLKEIKNGH